MLAGGKNGPVVEAAQAQDSELVRRIKGQSLPRMPMTGPPCLSDAETAVIERWVAAGLAPGVAGAKAEAPVSTWPAPGEAVRR